MRPSSSALSKINIMSKSFINTLNNTLIKEENQPSSVLYLRKTDGSLRMCVNIGPSTQLPTGIVTHYHACMHLSAN
jgi:hypothetical protein